ncbi:S-layer homology domain-containing protein [Thermolongibacillus altinsuensis]
MKKYPFSKKALRAMLAASIAFTPVVATGVPGVGVNEVQAAYTSIDQLVDRLDSIYDNMTDDEKQAINTARENVQSIQDELLEDILENIVVNSDQADLLKVAITRDLLTLFYSADREDLEEAIEKLKDNYTMQDLEEIFGVSGLTIDMLLTYMADFEMDLLNELADEDVDSLTSVKFYTQVLDSLENAAEKSKENEDIYDALINTIDIDLDGLLSLKQTYKNEIDPNNAARNALINALKREISDGNNDQDGNNQGNTGGIGGGGATPPVSTLPSETKAENGKVTVGQDVVKVEERTNEQGQKEKVVVIDATKIANIVNNVTAENKEIAVPIGQLVAGEVAKAEVPAKLFADAANKEAKAVLTIQAEQAAYKLPVAEIQAKLQDLVKKLGVASADDIVISISMNPVDKQQVAGKYKWNVVSNVVEFHVVASANGKTEPITRFTQYVERELTGSKTFDATHSVAVRINDDGTFASVPTLFNEKTATVKSLTNSAYTVIENNKTFADVDNGKTWAEKYIETLASKYIIKGKTDSLYAPKEEMTRAQFAVLLVRALGLPGETYDGHFKDVKGNEWFNANGELMAAVKHGIVQGNSDGTFAPNAKITRAQAAVMIGRAMKLGFLNYDFTKLNTAKKVTDFKDAKDVRAWAKEGVEKVYQAGIFAGRGDGRFYPNSYMKRDEMAKALAEFLVSAKLMNPIE